MIVRALFLLLLLSMPFEARAAQYVVRPGDTLTSIARRYHVSLPALAHINRIANVNLIQAGRVLLIPVQGSSLRAPAVPYATRWHHVRWGDTLFGIALQNHLTIALIRALNPWLGRFPLAGQWLKLCGPCYADSATPPPAASTGAYGTLYVVRPGDTLSAVAARYGTTPGALVAANRLVNPNLVRIGAHLRIPQGVDSAILGYDPWSARSLIVTYARQYGIEPSLPLAVAWQESGFNQTMVSRTGAVGVMQVEPYTGRHISTLLDRPFNLYQADDNVHAGVYWLAHLLAYYGGNERLATAAYYQGTRSLASHGFYQDTNQYVNNVMSLKTSFGG